MSCIDGFRLAAPSECSLRSKARIDSLFEDSRSVCSSSWCTIQDEVCGDDDQRRVNSAVQARIEAMFASVEAESSVPGECAAAVLPVKYMGAAPVGGRVASVRGLQEPLRQLVERIGDSVNAELEVSRRGLTFRTNELHEKNNPFRRIAVWSALKLQTRKRPNSNNSQDLLYAFVPLVADERNPSLVTPSTTNNTELERHADLYRTMRGLVKNVEDYPPIFAVVMRRPGAARLLECHAFACRTEEDAIAAAATLYRALLADLDATSRRPRQTNGLGCVSLASAASSLRETSPGSKRRIALDGRIGHMVTEKISPPSPPPVSIIMDSQPVRPPRVKKNSISSNTNTEDEQSSSTPCTSVSVIEKAPRRKGKISDIKAEDVLEARKRRFGSSSSNNDSNLSEANDHTRRNSNSGSQSSHEETNEERRMNAKNKIYGTRSSRCQAVASDDVQVIENVYDERKSTSEHRNDDDKSSSDRGRNNLYDFDCCTENSIYESSRIYSKACELPTSKRNESRIYEMNPTSSRKSIGSSSSIARRENHLKRPTVPPPKKPQTHAEQRRRSITSNNNTAARHRDHFRDVDKISSLASDDIYGRSTGKGNNNRIYDVTRHERHSGPSIRSDISEKSVRSTKRLSRVSTMDRPLRKSNHDSTTYQQQEIRRQQRRKSRAGSEPPNARTTPSIILKRSQSDLEVDRGDLLTRVELPRRGSFLKQPGSIRKRDGPEGSGGGTPLGFTELFDEFRNQEGLTSVDDILAAIIDPEGMSFNELKPLYKEFLLKLAATLTQDELYQRSASIMRRRRRRSQQRQRRTSRASSNNNNNNNNRPACLLSRAIKRSVSRLRSNSAASAPTEFTSVIFPARRLNGNNNNNVSSNNDRSSYGSSASSCDAAMRNLAVAQNGHRHKVIASKLGRRRSMTRCSSSKSRIGQTTSEDSDTCRRLNRSMLAANRSSSGYVSCSECSYDSESCTCISADKCYCSLSRKISADDPATVQISGTLCSCDTDTCSESNKCYCARKPINQQQQQHQPSILEQLRQKGIVPSESTLSRNASPDRARSTRANGKLLASSKSLEYLRVRSSSIRHSADNLALDYDLFSPIGGRRSSQCSSSSEKVLVVSARDPQGRLIYVGGTEHNDVGKGSSRRCSNKHRHRDSTGHHEALSIKKSAEIAAVFGGHQRLGRRTSSASSLKSSISLEAGLGYLP